MEQSLELGFKLDRQWYWLRGEMPRSKKPALYQLAKVLAQWGSDYAIIGGVALQIHQKEPRTTLDIDVAVVDRALLPVAQLEAKGFRRTGSYAHSENWLGPESTPVQFTDDPHLRSAVKRAQHVALEDVELRVIRREDLLHEKLRAASDRARRQRKRRPHICCSQWARSWTLWAKMSRFAPSVHAVRQTS